MSREKRFAPEQELAKNNIPHFYRWRTLIIFCFFLSLTTCWAVCCRSCVADLTGHSTGFGTNSYGSAGANSNVPNPNSDSGNSGDGPGAGKAGKNGSAPGKFDQAKGVDGIGKDAVSTNHDNKLNPQAAAGINQQPNDNPEIMQPPVHVENIARETPPPVPEKVVTPQISGSAPRRGQSFYGVAVRKTSRILFIVDCSGSMSANSSKIAGKARIDVLKMELEKALFVNISKYSTGGFAIVKFDDDAKLFPKKKNKLCQYSDTKLMQEAKDFVDQLYPTGGTNMKKAWNAAVDVIKKQNIDTVYFLTDGEPGDDFDPAWLKKTLKKSRINNKLTINCIAIGDAGLFLMKKIANDYRGSFVLIP